MADWLTLNEQIFFDAKESDFAGYDPFDGLNSPLFSCFPSLKNSMLGLAWLQFHKRNPLNLRPVCGIKPARNPKGIGLFIMGLVEDYTRTTGQQALLTQADELGKWLLEQECCSQQWDYPCWGYHFDWKARAFYVPKGKPNIITTYYVSQALWTLGQALNNDDYCRVALNSAKFIYQHLLRSSSQGQYLAYIPGEDTFVHNASLWGAAWLVKAGYELKEQHLIDAGVAVARTSVNHQKEDGSWYYGTRDHHQFIDGFHSGYNLEALKMITDCTQFSEFQASIDRGMAFYREHFFSSEGDAKYYHNQPYPYDMHSVSQAVLTFIKVSGHKQDMNKVEQILNRAVETLYLPDKGRFAYQKTKSMTNRIDYIRWTRAWVYYALAVCNREVKEGKG